MEEIKSYKYFGFFYKFPLLSGFLGFLLAFFLSQLITLKDYQILKGQEKDEVLSYSSLIEEKINNLLQEAYSAATVLTFLYERVDFEKEFDGVGQEVLRKFPLIDAIQWNEEGVIKYVYPLEENKAAIGFDIFNDTVTHRYIEAYWAIEKGEIFFSGPYELKQGGMGIVGRLPIFKEGKFFAFSVVIFRLETFFDMLEYDPVESKYYVQFSKINPVTHVEEFFLPLQEGYEGFKTVKTIKQGNWILTVQLKKSNAVFQMLPPFLSMSFFSILFGIAVYFLAKLPSILEKEVSKKSRALRIIVRRFRMASKATSDAIWEWDLINDKIYRSNNFVKLFGYSFSFFNKSQKLFEDLIHPDDKERVLNNFKKFLRGKDYLWSQEFRFLKETGEFAHVLDKGILLRTKDGLPKRFFGAIQDISILKERELQLIKLSQSLDQRANELQEAILRLDDSEKRYRDLFELSPLPMWVYDLETLRFLDVNQAAISSYGYSKEEFLSMTIKDIRPNKDISLLEEKVNVKKEMGGLLFSGIFHHLKKNGDLIEVEISSNRIEYNGLKGVLVLAVDVTLRNQYIEAIEVQNARLKEIAWMQSHVVRAPLARLLGLVNMLKIERIHDPQQSIENFEELFEFIFSSAQELDKVIRQVSEKTERIHLKGKFGLEKEE